MISYNSTVLKKLFNKPITRVGIESVKVGNYVRTVNITNGDYSYSKVLSIVKVTLPRYEMTTTCFDTLYCTTVCKFMTLDGLFAWSPSHGFDLSTRLCKRDAAKLLTPFIKSVKFIGYPTVFYDVILENKNEALLVDGYAKIYG